MSLIGEIVDQIQIALGGGISSAENRFDDDYIEVVIHQIREEICNVVVNGTRDRAKNTYIDPAWYSKIFPLTYSMGNQDASAPYVVFTCPEMLEINSHRSGFAFVGDKSTMTPWSEIESPQQAADLRYLNDTRNIYYNKTDATTMRVYGDRDVNQGWVIGAVRRPTDLNTLYYNPDTDQYPIPEGLIPMLIEMAKAKLLGLEKVTPQDLKVDANPDAK